MWRRNAALIRKSLANTPYQNVEISTRLHHVQCETIVQSRRPPLLSKHHITSEHTNVSKHFIMKRNQHSKSNKIDFDNKDNSPQNSNFTTRTHTCGELSSAHVGQRVILCGWVQFQRLSKFLLLRDGYGITQCINRSSNTDLSSIHLETVLKIEGVVAMRPKDMVNPSMATGDIEVVIESMEVLNTVEKLPFNLRDYQKPKEQLRLQHRYVDLRFPEMQRNLRERSTMLHNMRRFLIEQHGFVEVETPTLFCRTPGGAREFVVPTHHSGLFYSLVQSPQQFKQMLMSGGIDRYFQVARCYRDEATRPDRQPEFTQLDIELSFTNLDGVLSMIEQLLYETFLKNLPRPPFSRMTYREAIESYGSDKPNLTYDLKLRNITKLFDGKNDTFRGYCLEYPQELGKLTAKFKETINTIKKKYKTKIVLSSNFEKEFGVEQSNRIRKNLSVGTEAIVSLGENYSSCQSLGEIRSMVAALLENKSLLKTKEDIQPLWVVDFPLFLKSEEGHLETCHHPFTAPHPDDLHLLEIEPLRVRSLAYDIVLNGNEIGGGSVRIHNSLLQEKILRMLDIDPESLDHFLNALKCGCPPHAGIALGIDRLMVLACKAESIRDVIAFPKSHEGKDPLSGAPNIISNEDRKYYHLL